MVKSSAHPILCIASPDEWETLEEFFILASGFRITWVRSTEGMSHALSENYFAGIVSSFPIPGMTEEATSVWVEEKSRELPLIFFVRDTLPMPQAVRLLKGGAADIVPHSQARRVPIAMESAVDNFEARLNLKMSELTLREQEESFRQLCEAGEEGILIYANSRILNANSALCRLFGYSSHDLIGANILKLFQQSDWATIQKQLRADSPMARGYSAVRKSGEFLPVEVAAKVIHFQGARLEALLFRDIRARLQAEQALRDSESKFRALADGSPAAIFVSKGGQLEYANRTMESITGYKISDLRKMSLFDLVHPDFRQLVAERAFARLKGADVPPRYQFKIRRKDGKERWIDFIGASIHYQDEPAALGTAFDITKFKQVDENTVNETISKFARTLTHEINNILAPALLAVHLLEEKVADEEARGFLRTLQSSLERAAALAERTFKVAKEANAPQRPDHPGKGPLPRGQGETILIADDEGPIRDITKSTLEAYGYKTVSAANGAEALELFVREPSHFSAALMDMMMPVRDGISTIIEMEKLSPEFPVIAMSGVATHQPEARNASRSVRAFLHKPFTAEKLLLTLREVIDSPKVSF